MSACRLFSVALVFFLAGPLAQAWEKHQSLMPDVLSGLPEGVSRRVDGPIQAPCLAEDRAIYAELAKKLGLQAGIEVRPTAARACLARRPTTGREILLSEAVDDPDNGMDQNLPDTTDPQGDRKWMGGEKGPTSQGFRHMYFGGWQARKPITTFQVPLRAVGRAPERAEALAYAARELFQQGRPAWGFRVLAWALHFVQDLAQPFHSVQIPSLRLVPWYVLLTWPPQRALRELVSETTRSISNFHYAYEGYTLFRLEQGPQGPFTDCLPRAEELSGLEAPGPMSPRGQALAVVEQSLRLGSDLGSGVIEFFGGGLRGRDHDLPQGVGVPSYSEISIRPDLMEKRARLDSVSCRALSNALVASRRLIAWVLEGR